MCGIAGIVRVGSGVGNGSAAGATPTRRIPPAWLDVLERAIRHRGPDGHGTFRDHRPLPDGREIEVALVHRRLAVLDPADGRQPMLRSRTAELGRWESENPPTAAAAPDLLAVVFNGCIYNHRALRTDLAGRGHRFESGHSDTEVILHAWRAWGQDSPAHLDGMFALALWDRQHGRLFLSRDRAGEKPLYYWTHRSPEGDELLAFASSVRALMDLRREMGAGVPTFDAQLLRRWMIFGFDDQPPIEGMGQVRPGAWLSLSGDGVSRGGYWSAPRRGAAPEGGLLEMLRSSVVDRLDADVPLGCFLSGGLDSPLIAAMARQAKADLRTFTVRMPDHRYDESDRAARIARHLGTSHTTLECHAKPAEDLVALITGTGLPLGDSSLLPTHWVSRAAREHVTVALSGDGADELFGGYQRYAAARWLRNWRGLLALLPFSGAEAHPKSRRSKLARLADAARGWGYMDLLAIFPKREAAGLIGSAADGVVAEGEMLPDDPPRSDFATYLPGDLLRKVDTASMAVALEVRAPYLATGMIDRCLRAPTPRFGKAELRDLAAQLLPPDIASAPKSGFAIPIGDWFRTDFGGLRRLLRETLADPRSLESLSPALPIDVGRVKSLMDQHFSGAADHSQRLYHLLVMAIWARSML